MHIYDPQDERYGDGMFDILVGRIADGACADLPDDEPCKTHEHHDLEHEYGHCARGEALYKGDEVGEDEYGVKCEFDIGEQQHREGYARDENHQQNAYDKTHLGNDEGNSDRKGYQYCKYQNAAWLERRKNVGDGPHTIDLKKEDVNKEHQEENKNDHLNQDFQRVPGLGLFFFIF